MKKNQFVLHNNKNVKMFDCKKNIRGRDNLRFEFERKKVKTIGLYFLLSERVIRRAFLLWFPVWRQEDPVCEAAASLTEAQGHGHAPEVVTINSWICFQSKYK